MACDPIKQGIVVIPSQVASCEHVPYMFKTHMSYKNGSICFVFIYSLFLEDKVYGTVEYQVQQDLATQVKHLGILLVEQFIGGLVTSWEFLTAENLEI